MSIIQATDVDGGARAIDPALRDLPQLTRDQPFVRYNVYRLLERRQYPFEVGRVVSVGLPNGRTLLATLDAVALERTERRYQIEAQIAEPGKQAFLRGLHVTTSENTPFFVGGAELPGRHALPRAARPSLRPPSPARPEGAAIWAPWRALW